MVALIASIVYSFPMKQQGWDRPLRRSQLDRILAVVGKAFDTPRPRRGWIREIRDSLGMSARQLGARVGVSQSTLAVFERREVEGTITLQSLERVAEALDCRLVYAFVPRESLDAMVRHRALQVASGIVDGVAHTMRLEDQSESPQGRRQRIEQEADHLVQVHLRQLWDEPA